MMHRAQEQVRDFMRAMGQPTPETPRTRIAADRLEFRLRLIKEEAEELEQAINSMEAVVGPPVAGIREVTTDQVDALCDLLYVTYGMAVELGLDLEPFFELVHEANMKKGPGPVREDGKKLKPEGWMAPDHHWELSRQRQRNRFSP